MFCMPCSPSFRPLTDAEWSRSLGLNSFVMPNMFPSAHRCGVIAIVTWAGGRAVAVSVRSEMPSDRDRHLPRPTRKGGFPSAQRCGVIAIWESSSPKETKLGFVSVRSEMRSDRDPGLRSQAAQGLAVVSVRSEMRSDRDLTDKPKIDVSPFPSA